MVRVRVDETPVIREGNYVSHEVELSEGDQLLAEVSAEGEVNVYLLTKRNLTLFDNDEEFWYEAGSEAVDRVALRFTAPRDGKWFFVVENADEEDVSANLRVVVSSRRT